MASLGNNALADFVRLVGEDDKLDVLSCAIDKHIQSVGIDDQSDVAEHYHPHIMEDGPAGGNNQEIENQQGASERDVAILVDKCRDDVPSACASAREEYDADAQTVQDSTQHTPCKG